MKKIALYFLLLFALVFEILRVYLIMPMPGSQQMNSIDLAYFLGSNKNIIRFALFFLIGMIAVPVIRKGSRTQNIILTCFGVLFSVVFYVINFTMEADKMFYQPTHKYFHKSANNKIDTNKLVLGIESGDQSKAYPIQLIGYHHQVMDTIGKTSVMVTYCTVCRTGRVFHPIVNGKLEKFRLVGMDHFNAMFEDETTKSWWAQATGECIAGPLKGQRLNEFPSVQVRLNAWLKSHPNSEIMQPDEKFTKEFAGMDVYDEGKSKGSLTKRDSASWKFKSWVVGVDYKGNARTYDWNLLASKRLIQDSVSWLPMMVVLEPDNASFHCYNRLLGNEILNFKMQGDGMIETTSGSIWDYNGKCVSGKFKGSSLEKINAYQEFLHSWEYFHPKSVRY
jgi:hypothetical protein